MSIITLKFIMTYYVKFLTPNVFPLNFFFKVVPFIDLANLLSAL